MHTDRQTDVSEIITYLQMRMVIKSIQNQYVSYRKRSNNAQDIYRPVRFFPKWILKNL